METKKIIFLSKKTKYNSRGKVKKVDYYSGYLHPHIPVFSHKLTCEDKPIMDVEVLECFNLGKESCRFTLGYSSVKFRSKYPIWSITSTYSNKVRGSYLCFH